ncbi:MAG: SAF domain-containing protein [Beutenbergiaceae bacterium]
MATQFRRPHWRDPRLGVGVLLVVASVALGSWVFARVDHSIEVYQARVTLSPGDVVLAADLAIVQARLDEVAGSYLQPDDDLEGMVITRMIPAGDLVPVSALGRSSDIAVRPVQVPMSAGLQQSVQGGSIIDLWVALPDPEGGPGALLAPQPLVSAVEVSGVYEDTTMFAGPQEVLVQVLIPVADLAEVLAAQAGGGQLTVVPVPGGEPA